MGRWIGALFVVLLAVACSRTVQRPPIRDLRVVSFNVRYGTAKDGANAWAHRKDLVVDHLRALDADIVGAQEMMAFQSDYVESALPSYARVGIGRIDGRRAGEYAAIYFRRSRFTKIDEGHFWLSPTPEKVGSTGWDAQLPRVATWVVLEERVGGARLFVLNTHFDHVGEKARAESARLVRERIAVYSKIPTIVTGDFNSGPSGPTYERMVAPGLVDTFRAVHAAEDGGTFHGFGEILIDERIDWILCSPQFKVKAATIERTKLDGRWPSDHYAVTAVVSE